MNPKQSIKERIRTLDMLPAMREVAQKILALPLNTDSGERQLLELVSKDQMLTAKIVGLANSPILGATRKISSINDAAQLLGLAKVKYVAVSVAIITTLTKQPKGKLDIHYLWVHSMAMAITMNALARRMRVDLRPKDEEVFMVGLLHDIGFMVLDQLEPEHSDLLMQKIAELPDRGISEIEAELLPVSHAEIGAELVAHWNFPQQIVAAIRDHHADAAHGKREALTELLKVAEKLLPTFNQLDGNPGAISEAEWEFLGIDAQHAAAICSEIGRYSEQAGEMASILSS